MSDHVPTEHQMELASEYAHLQAEAGAITARMDEIKKTFRHDLPYGTHEINGLKVTIGKNPSFNAARFEADHPVHLYPNFYKATVDRAALKQELSPKQLEQYNELGDARITIK